MGVKPNVPAITPGAPLPEGVAQATDPAGLREIVFISKATPGDDEFVLWLAPRLEAAGYQVFADILSLDAGSRWRKHVTGSLQNRAVKMLLCCRDSTLAKDGVLEEIGIAEDVARDLSDPKFIIPLRLEPFKKVFGIGELQWVDFSKSWADGLNSLLKELAKQNVPRDPARVTINPNWEIYRRRNAVAIKPEPEPLTSNWLRVIEMPDHIRYFEPSGAIDHGVLKGIRKVFRYPAEPYMRGFFSFATLDDVEAELSNLGKFKVSAEIAVSDFTANGWEEKALRSREAKNYVQSMFRQAWNLRCRERGLAEYQWSSDSGFHAGAKLVATGQKIPWGRQGAKRSSMLRNVAKGHVWNFGFSALPSLWPFEHFKLKQRVLFSEHTENGEGAVIDDKDKQHRLRRKVCKGWRNKQWHGRLMAMLELLSEDLAYIYLPLGAGTHLVLEASPVLFTSPVTTVLPDLLGDDDEEFDDSTITGVVEEEAA
jgi:hypothetical protein